MTFSLDLKLGAANEVVKILIDGKLVRVRGTRAQSGCRDARHGHSVGFCPIAARRSPLANASVRLGSPRVGAGGIFGPKDP